MTTENSNTPLIIGEGSGVLQESRAAIKESARRYVDSLWAKPEKSRGPRSAAEIMTEVRGKFFYALGQSEEWKDEVGRLDEERRLRHEAARRLA